MTMFRKPFLETRLLKTRAAPCRQMLHAGVFMQMGDEPGPYRQPRSGPKRGAREPFLTADAVCALARRHILARKRMITVEDLQAVPLIAGSPGAFQKAVVDPMPARALTGLPIVLRSLQPRIQIETVLVWPEDFAAQPIAFLKAGCDAMPAPDEFWRSFKTRQNRAGNLKPGAHRMIHAQGTGPFYLKLKFAWVRLERDAQTQGRIDGVARQKPAGLAARHR
jgi:hypothetical protein